MTGGLWPSRLRGGRVCHPSLAGRIGGLGLRAEGRAQRAVFHAHALGLRRLRAAARFRWLRYLAVAVFFALGLMAKPMLVTLPFVLLLLDYWPLGTASSGRATAGGAAGRSLGSRPGWSSKRSRLLALAIGSCVATVCGRKAQAVAVRTSAALCAHRECLGFVRGLCRPDVLPGGTGGLLSSSGWRRLPYGRRPPRRWCWRQSRRPPWPGGGQDPYLSVGWLWYLGMLVPVIGLVQVGGQAMADRYTYLPRSGCCWRWPGEWPISSAPGPVFVASLPWRPRWR